MTPDRWLKVVELFNRALERDSDERAAFLNEACRGDDALRFEVDSLLTCDQSNGSFLEKPAFELAAQELSQPHNKKLTPSSMDLPKAESPVTRNTAKSYFLWFVVVAGIVVLSCYVFAGLMILRYGTLTKEFGWESTSAGNGLYISKVSPDGAAAGELEVGDRIVSVNGDRSINSVLLYNLRWGATPDSSYTVGVSRGSTQHEVQLTVALNRTSRNFGHILSLLPLSLAFYVLAMLVGIYKPEARTTQIACAASFAIALVMLGFALTPLAPFFEGWEQTTYVLIGLVYPLHLPLAYDFYSRFPPVQRGGRVWPSLKLLLYVGSGAIMMVFAVMRLTNLQAGQMAATYYLNPGYYKALPLLHGSITLLALAATCGIMIRNYRQVTAPDESRRIKWIIYGSIAGLLPVTLFNLARLILTGAGYAYIFSSDTLIGLARFTNLVIIIVPITLGYVIVRHHVLDIDVVLRRGLQYLLAKNVLRLILALPIIGLAYTILSRPSRTLSEILFSNSIYLYLLFGCAITLSLKFRRQLRNWLDRKFFREAYSQNQILRGLIEEVKRLDSMADICERVRDQVERALHPERVYIFIRKLELRDLALACSSGQRSREIRIPSTFRLLRAAVEQRGAQDLTRRQKVDLPQVEREWLDELGTTLIVPISDTSGSLAGLLLLGPKRSEARYTRDDLELLEALADQIGLVHEIDWLKTRVDRDRKIQQDVIARFQDQNSNLLKECPSCGLCFDSSVQVCESDGEELTLSLPVPRTIEERYQLVRSVGKGAMGAVYQAIDLRLKRNVAVKILDASMFGEPAALRRFKREAQTLGKLKHPNIISVHDYGELITEGAYLVMDLVEGESLAEVIEREGSIKPEIAAQWFNQLLEGVEAAHAAGVIHRDMKPDNVLIAKQENGASLVKILDFGLAKSTRMDTSLTENLTTPGMIIGTVGYMSPEQLAGESVDERSDFFSIGVMVVEALTGRRPFQRRTIRESFHATLNVDFNLECTSPELQKLDDVLQKCLAKIPADRYNSATDMQKELIPAIRACSSL
ncbi:MAG TPA: protein kinase [Pyrinomonadaceae bacterium]|nr:protein kinase [Pyrinomonadaceae bacterium]